MEKGLYPFLKTSAVCAAPKTAGRVLDRYVRGNSPKAEREWMENHMERCMRCEVMVQNWRTVQRVLKRFRLDPSDRKSIAARLTTFDLDAGLKETARKYRKKPAK